MRELRDRSAFVGSNVPADMGTSRLATGFPLIWQTVPEIRTTPPELLMCRRTVHRRPPCSMLRALRDLSQPVSQILFQTLDFRVG